MSWIMETIEHGEFTITRQTCVNPDLGEGDMITVEINGVEEDFASVESAIEYLDELADELAYTRERERRYWARTGHRPGFWF